MTVPFSDRNVLARDEGVANERDEPMEAAWPSGATVGLGGRIP
jgi:hypothetical protein